MTVTSDDNPHALRWRNHSLSEWAIAQVGICEATNKNDGEPSKLYMGGRKEPWCAHFVATGYRAIGWPLPGDIEPSPSRANPCASVTFIEKSFAKAGWLNAVDIFPEKNDLIFLSERGLSDKASAGRHIGIVVYANSTHVISVEGNWGNAVKRVVRRRDIKTISGYGRRPSV